MLAPSGGGLILYQAYGNLYAMTELWAGCAIHVSVEENLGDPIKIRVDVVHPTPIAAITFPAASLVAENASLRATIKYIFRSSAGRKFFKKPKHFSNSIVDLLALLKDGIFKSLHSFTV
ncbi:hypothetical protein Tco_0426283 [Tanacetum coccineum]